jgi:ActR/RegA family two-component response regulator
MIRNIVIIATTALCSYLPTTAAQTTDSLGTGDAVIDGAAVDAAVDTIFNAADDGNTAADTAMANGGGKDAVELDDEELIRAALAVDSVKITEDARRLNLIRRDYEYKRQTRAAIVMMIFIAMAMATSQSWNPR